MKSIFQKQQLLLALIAAFCLSNLNACNSGGSSNGASTSSPTPIADSPAPIADSPAPIQDITIGALPSSAMSISLVSYLDEFADMLYGTQISNFTNKMYGNNELTSPNPIGWENNGAQYAFGYNVPYVQTYSPSVMSFLTPLAVNLQCGNKKLFFVVQPVSNIQDTNASTQSQGQNGTNVIIKYHSLFSDGIAPYPAPFNVDFALNSIDSTKYAIPQQISIHAHDGVWSPATQNIALQAAFLDYTPHIIISKMTHSGASVYSVNNMINYNQLSATLNILNSLPIGQLTLANFRNAIKLDPSLAIIADALDSYNQLVIDNCDYGLWQ